MEGFSSGARTSIYLTHNHAEKSCLPCTIAANDTNNAYNPNTQIKGNVVSSSSSSSNGFLNFHHFWDLHPMFGQLLGESGKIHSRKKQKNNWHGNAHIYLPPGGRLKFRLSTRRRPLKPFRKACASTTTFPRRGPGGRNIDSSRSVFWYSLAFWRSSSYARSRAWDNYTELKSLKQNRTALDVNTKCCFVAVLMATLLETCFRRSVTLLCKEVNVASFSIPCPSFVDPLHLIESTQAHGEWSVAMPFVACPPHPFVWPFQHPTKITPHPFSIDMSSSLVKSNLNPHCPGTESVMGIWREKESTKLKRTQHDGMRYKNVRGWCKPCYPAKLNSCLQTECPVLYPALESTRLPVQIRNPEPTLTKCHCKPQNWNLQPHNWYANWCSAAWISRNSQLPPQW